LVVVAPSIPALHAPAPSALAKMDPGLLARIFLGGLCLSLSREVAPFTGFLA
jgi:hypothetical protein